MNISNSARRSPASIALAVFALTVAALAGCGTTDNLAPPANQSSFPNHPCSATGTVQLATAQTVRVDCSNGGTTVTLAGNGASYLVVAQFAVDNASAQFIPYHLTSGTAISASLASLADRASLSRFHGGMSATAATKLPTKRVQTEQRAFTGALRARALRSVRSGAWTSSAAHTSRVTANRSARTLAAATTVPTLGSIRSFQVIADQSGATFTTTAARLAYVGSNVLIYVDTLAPTNGFTTAQLQAFGLLFDQTFYPIDTAAFGPPSDIDQNGHVIMLMTPSVNRLVSTTECQQNGYIAGFFNEEDLGGSATDPDSNNGEIFYSVVPDPSGTTSCAHTISDLGLDVPATFMHEFQHLISFSQHVVVHGGQPEAGWLDEGLSVLSEELGSLYYERKCPGTACRTDPTQIFPDSSQGFVADFLYDSYQYALLPDTASLTTHSDGDDGFSWRGGDWLLMRWLGDQLGTGIYKRLEQSTLTGVANIEGTTGQTFPSLFSNFGLAIYTDSLPGLPRTTAPAADRFVSRNLRQLWSRLYQTAGGASDVPYAFPVGLFPINGDTSTTVMDPGTMSFYRLDTPTGASTVSLQFAGPGGVPLPGVMRPQLAIFRLPAGQ